MNQGDPGLETWASLDAARHGGAQVWIPGSYDPETHLYIFGTGNPTPAYTATLRASSDVHTNLFTCSVVALRSEEHTSELQSLRHLVCRLLLEKKKENINT